MSGKGYELENDLESSQKRKADACMHVSRQNISLLKNNHSLPTAGATLSTFQALSDFILKITLWVGCCYFPHCTAEEARPGEVKELAQVVMKRVNRRISTYTEAAGLPAPALPIPLNGLFS